MPMSVFDVIIMLKICEGGWVGGGGGGGGGLRGGGGIRGENDNISAECGYTPKMPMPWMAMTYTVCDCVFDMFDTSHYVIEYNKGKAYGP